MADLVKTGAVVTFLGFLAVGSAVLYLAVAPAPTTPEEIQAAQQVARNSGVVQAVGWVVAGVGLGMALFGLAKSVVAIDTKSEISLERLPPPVAKSKPEAKFVCSDCGGDISENAVVCPHCGSSIED